MRRFVRTTLILMGLGSVCVTVAAQTPSLYETYSRSAEVRVCVAASPSQTETESKSLLEAAILKPALEKAFETRKSIHFHVVPSAEEADLALDFDVQGFVFNETDPVDMLMGAAAVAMDAATQDHFSAADVLFTVRDVKAGNKVLWRDKLHASVTDHTMTVDES